MTFMPSESGTKSLNEYPTMFVVLLCVLLVLSLVFALYDLLRGAEEHARPPLGCRKLGLQGRSNLSDQYDSAYRRGVAAGEKSDGSPLWKVKALFIYPVKSCGPVELDHSNMERTGMAYDRQFAFAQLVSPQPQKQKDGSYTVDHHWKVITLREFPLLSKVKTEVWIPDESSPDYSPSGGLRQAGGYLVVTFPFTPVVSFSFGGLKSLAVIVMATLRSSSLSAKPTVSFRIPLNPSAELIKQERYETERMVIFKDMPEALNMSSAIPADTLAKLKYFLGVRNPLALFRVAPGKQREVYRCAPRKADIGYQPVVGFADGYPLHILNLASVRDVESRLPKGHGKLDAIRFRSNIYVTGPEKFAEDYWKLVQIGSHNYHVSCRTARCKLPNVDPETGIKDRNQPLTTLTSYRLIDEGAGTSPCLGMQMVPISGDGAEIKVGDEVAVLETGAHYYIKPGTS